MYNQGNRQVCAHCGQSHLGGKANCPNWNAPVPSHRNFPKLTGNNRCPACIRRQQGAAPAVQVPPVPAPVPAPPPPSVYQPVEGEVHPFTFNQTLSLQPNSAGKLIFDSNVMPKVLSLLTWHRKVTLNSAVATPLLEGGVTGQVWLVFDHDQADVDSLVKMADHSFSQFFTAGSSTPSLALNPAPDGLQIASRRLHSREPGIPGFVLYGYSTVQSPVVVRTSITVWAKQRFRDGPPSSAAAATLALTSFPAGVPETFVPVPQIPGLFRLTVTAGHYLRFAQVTGQTNRVFQVAPTATGVFVTVPGGPGQYYPDGVTTVAAPGLVGLFQSNFGANFTVQQTLDVYVVIS